MCLLAYVPSYLVYLRALASYVPACLGAYLSYVPTRHCLLSVYVLHAFVIYVLTCQCVLRANERFLSYVRFLNYIYFWETRN